MTGQLSYPDCPETGECAFEALIPLFLPGYCKFLKIRLLPPSLLVSAGF